MDKSSVIAFENPASAPIEQCGYYMWLERQQPDDIHALVHKLQYLEQEFNFVKGEDSVSSTVLDCLRCIESAWWNINRRPEDTHYV